MLKPLPIYQYCFALVADGQTEKAREWVNNLIEKSKTEYVMPNFLAIVHVALGEFDRAFDYFEKSFEERNHWLLWFGTDAKLDPIRTDERYFKLLERMNNPLFEKQKPQIKSELSTKIHEDHTKEK
jgi:hypothetical protein